jgi:hypothetical protein
MNKQMKSGIMESLSRTEMKKILGGVAPSGGGAACKDSDCQPEANGVRKKCPTGCKCDSAEGNPCY